MAIERLREIDVNDILADPHQFGMPTFDEFKKNPEKWLGRDDELLSSADVGCDRIKNVVKRHIYEIEGYRTRKLEEVERIAESQGIPLKQLDYRPQIIPLGGGYCDILVKFVSKRERQKRSHW